VHTLVNNGADYIVNEIGPYSGKKILPNGTFMIIIKASGDWTMTLEK
jgi:hypothetical protein